MKKTSPLLLLLLLLSLLCLFASIDVSICYSRPLVLLLQLILFGVVVVAATVANVTAAAFTIYVISQTIFGCWNIFAFFRRSRDIHRKKNSLKKQTNKRNARILFYYYYLPAKPQQYVPECYV